MSATRPYTLDAAVIVHRDPWKSNRVRDAEQRILPVASERDRWTRADIAMAIACGLVMGIVALACVALFMVFP